MTRAPIRMVFAVLVLATLSLTLAQRKPGPATPDPVDQDAAAPRRSLIASGETPDLFLIYTGDVIGYLDPCG
jgi:hypothetical protein